MKKTEIQKIKKELLRGDLKTIGAKTGFHRNYVGEVLSGKISLTEYNYKIISAALEIIEERRAINKKANQLLNE